jgi:hypothetical protein
LELEAQSELRITYYPFFFIIRKPLAHSCNWCLDKSLSAKKIGFGCKASLTYVKHALQWDMLQDSLFSGVRWMNTISSKLERVGPRPGMLYGLFVLGLGTCLAGNLAIRLIREASDPPVWVLIAIGIATAFPLVLAACLFWRLMRQNLDEMLQRIVLEGLAFGLIVYVPLAGLFVNLRTAGLARPQLDPPDILMIPAILVAIGIALAWRKYK